MRKTVVALSAIAFTIGTLAMVDVAAAKTTKLGCVVGKERWDAAAGKCVAGKPVKKAAKASTAPKTTVVKKAVKKAAKKPA